MLQALSKTTVLASSFVLMSIMFVIVMFYVNPAIDGGDGSGVLELQLSFEKNAGIEIINEWGGAGVNHFKRWIFTDYIYAFSYSLFLASLISSLVLKRRKGVHLKNIVFVCVAFLSGALDFVENSMELFFIKNPYVFSDNLFFIHSIVATLKWIAVTVAIAYIIVLFTKKEESHL